MEMTEGIGTLEVGKSMNVLDLFRDMNEPTMLSTLCMMVDIAAARTGKTVPEVIDLISELTTMVGEQLGPWEEVQR